MDYAPFQAHVLVLGNASPFFKTMFSIDMKESKERLVRIGEFCHAAIWEMVRFIYGMMPDEEKLGFDELCDLFRAARMSAQRTFIHTVLLASKTLSRLESTTDLSMARLGNAWTNLFNFAKEFFMYRVSHLSRIGLLPVCMSKTSAILNEFHPRVTFDAFCGIVANYSTMYVLATPGKLTNANFDEILYNCRHVQTAGFLITPYP